MVSRLFSFHAAFRRLLREPGFAFSAIGLLATGIGAVTVVYSVINGILIRPLPYPDPGSLIGVQAVNFSKSIVQPAVSVADLRDFHERQKSLSALGGYRPDFATWTRPGQQPVQMAAALVTEDFFKVLGVVPLAGRIFTPDEFSAGAPRSAILSQVSWKRDFASDPTIVGRVIQLNSQPTTIVGVMPASMREPAFVDLWLPFPAESAENLVRDSRYWVSLGRLAPGASLAQVQAEATAVAADLDHQFPDTNRGWSLALAPLHEMRVGGLRHSLWMLFAGTSLLLLVACFNLANLLLARGLRRQGEMAIRQALGASRADLLRQILLENLLISLPGGILGVAAAYTAIRVFVNTLPPSLLPRSNEVSIDLPILLLVTGVTIGAGLLAGVLPALQAAQASPASALNEGSLRAGLGRRVRQAQQLLLVLQVSLTFVVLTGAALLARNLASLYAIQPGFKTADLYLTRLAPAPEQFADNLAMARYFERIAEAARGVPGVVAATVDASTPLAGITLSFPYSAVGAPPDSAASNQAVYHFVGYDAGLALGLRQIAGRMVDRHDDENGLPVVVVNECLARRLDPTGQVLGRRLRLVPWLSPSECQIVGVVADTRQANLTDSPPPQLFVPQRQVPWFFSTLLVRMQPGSPLPSGALRDALRQVDPALPGQLRPLQDSIDFSTAQPRLLATLFSLLAAIALAFTLLGIYACISFLVTQRTREFAVRLALGATPQSVLLHLAREILLLITVGLGLGLLGALSLENLLRSQLYGVSGHSPQVLVFTAASLTVAALISGLIPAIRASVVPPAEALRHT